MYSTYSKSTSHRGGGKGKSVKSISGHSEIISMSGLDVAVKPILDLNTVLWNNILAVKGILTEKWFLVDHEELKEDLVIKWIPEDEDIQQWIDLPSHTNIVTAYDQFEHDKNKFQLTEYWGVESTDLYRYIDKMKLNLALQVPRSYLQFIYEGIIQLSIGLEFAHDNHIIHGALNLSNVLLIKDDENPIFKLNNFKHGSVINTPLNIEANQWPFTKGKKKGFSLNDKKEILMLKDIYSLGICLLEMMIGRINENQYSITIDSLPLTWAELPESTPLIQVLVEWLNIDSISNRKGKLSNIKRILIKEYKKSFNKQFYNSEHIFTTDNPDILNKKAVFNNFRGKDSVAVDLWNEALVMKKSHQDSVINLLFHKWKSAILTDQDVIGFIDKVDAITEKDSTYILKALFMIGVGEKSDGLAILKKILQGAKSQVEQEESKDESRDSLSLGAGRETLKDEEIATQSVKTKATPIFHRIQLEKERYLQNQTISTEHSTSIWNINFSSMSRYMTTTSQDSIIVWSMKSNPRSILKINLDEPDYDTPTVSWFDPKASILYCYRKNDNKIMRFSIDVEESTSIPKEPLICPKEFNREVLDSLSSEDSPYISEMYFINEGKILRWVQYEKGTVRFADFDMETGKWSTRTAEKYEDKSIYKYGLTYVQHHDTLNEFLKRQEMHKNVIVFPEKDFETVVVLEKDDKKGENFLIYDVFNERIKRKIAKADNPKSVFAVQHDSQYLIYAKGKNIVMYSLEIPDEIDEFIKPIYFSKDHQKNPSRIVKEKDHLCSKIMSLLKLYKSK